MAETTGPLRQLRAHVDGRVQGVGFRYWTLSTASRLGLTGWVKNLPDGSVEVLAEGPEASLKTLAERLRRGPSMARVDEVTVRWKDYQGVHRHFSVEP